MSWEFLLGKCKNAACRTLHSLAKEREFLLEKVAGAINIPRVIGTIYQLV